MKFESTVHHVSPIGWNHLPHASPYHILGHARLGNAVGGGTIAQEDGSGLVILFTKSNLSCSSENSLISFLQGELHSIHFNIYTKKNENPSAYFPALGSLSSTSYNSSCFFSPLRENKLFNISPLLEGNQGGLRKINNRNWKYLLGKTSKQTLCGVFFLLVLLLVFYVR